MKQHYLKKKNFQQLKYGRYYSCRLHACEKSCKDFEIKNLGEYQDLHVKRDTLFLADVFKNIKKIPLKIYHLDPVEFTY